MNTLEIDGLLSRHPQASKLFAGVFPRDLLPFKIDPGRKCIFIINTDKSDGRGEHWVAVYFGGDGTAQYFDSFGFAPLITPVKNFIARNCAMFVYNNRHIQNFVSSSCGLFVVYFAQQKSLGVSFSKLLSIFHSTNLLRNDLIVWRQVQRNQTRM